MYKAVLKRKTIKKIINEEVHRALNEINSTPTATGDLKERTRKALGLLETEYVDLHQDLAAHLTGQGVSNRSLIELIKTFSAYVEALGDVIETIQ